MLGVSSDEHLNQISTVWRELVCANHPDKMNAWGVQKEALKLPEGRVMQINEVYEKISKSHAAIKIFI